MTAQIKIELDPAKAKAGYDAVEKAAAKAAAAATKMGRDSVAAGKSLEASGKQAQSAAAGVKSYEAAANAAAAAQQRLAGRNAAATAGMQKFGKSAQGAGSNVSAFTGQLAGLAGAAGLGGTGAALVSASSAMGEFGAKAALAGVVAGSLYSVIKDLREEIGRVSGEAGSAAATMADTTGMAAAVEFIGEFVTGTRGAAEELRNLQKVDAEFAKQQAASAAAREKEQERIAGFRAEFQAAELSRIQELTDARIEADAKMVAQIKDTEEEITRLRREQNDLIQAGKNLTGDLEDVELQRNKLAEELRQNLVRQNALRQQAVDLENKARLAAEEAHREKMKQLDEQRRAQLLADEERRRKIEGDASALRAALEGRGGGAFGPVSGGGFASPAAAAGGGDGIVRGRPKGPLQFGGLAGAVMGMSGATSAMAMNASQATAASPAFYGANMGGPGSRDRLRRGGAPGVGGTGDPVLDQLGGAFSERQIKEQVARQREAALRAERGTALDAAWANRANDRGGGRRVNREFDEKERQARRGAFRGDIEAPEQAKAIQELTNAQMKAQQKTGDADQATVAAIEKLLEMAVQTAEEKDELQQRVDALEKAATTQMNNSRQRQQRAGRGPG